MDRLNPFSAKQQPGGRGEVRSQGGLTTNSDGDFSLRPGSGTSRGVYGLVRRRSKKDSPGAIRGFERMTPPAHSNLSPMPGRGGTLATAEHGTSPMSLIRQTDPSADIMTTGSGPILSLSQTHGTQSDAVQSASTMGAQPTPREPQSTLPRPLPALPINPATSQPEFDTSTVAAAQAHFQLVQQLQQQVKTFKKEAGHSEQTNRILNTTINDLLDQAKQQTDHVRRLEQEMDQLRRSQEAFKHDWLEQLNRANKLSGDLTSAAKDRDYYIQEAMQWRRQYESVNLNGRTAKNKILDLTIQVGELKVSLVQARREASKVEGLNTQVSKHRQQEQALAFELQQKVEGTNRLEHDLAQSRGRIAVLEAQLQEHKKEIEQMDELLDRSASSTVAQPDANATLPLPETLTVPGEDTRWMPEADFDISRKLDSLWQDLTSWSKTYARSRAIDLQALPAGELGTVRQLLHPVMAQSPNDTPDLSSLLAMANKGPSILLLAILADAMYAKLFADPFFFMGENKSKAETTSATQSDLASHLDTTISGIFSSLREVDPDAANEWRVQTMRLLNPPTGVLTSGTQVTHLREHLQAGRAASVRAFTTSFLASLPAALVDASEDAKADQRYTELSEIVWNAAELASRLSTQKDQVLVKRLGNLSEEGTPTRFYANSKTLEHHALHNLHIDDSEHSLDGRKVLLVVHPLVVALGGKADGSRMSERVWKRAIVWMGA